MIYTVKNLLNVCFNNLLPHVGPIIIFLSAMSSAQESKTYLLQYKFRQGERLLYQTERHDSTIVSSDNQTNLSLTITWSLKSLSIFETPPDKPYTIALKTDSVWKDQHQSATENAPRDGVFKMVRGPREIMIEMTPEGKNVSKNTVFPPFLIPLPEKPVTINETWDVEITTEYKRRRKEKTTIKGQCLLYDVQENDTSVALILFNTESRSKGEFKRRMPQGKTTVSFESTGTSTSLVYFDIDRGRVAEVVTEEKRETATQSAMLSSTRSSTSTLTVKLLSE